MTTTLLILIAVALYVILVLLLLILFGKGIKIADERRPRPPRDPDEGELDAADPRRDID